MHDKGCRLDGEAKKLPRENAIKGHTDFKSTVFKLGLFSYEAEFEDIIVGVEREWESTSGKSLTIRVITDKKP